MNSYSPPRVGAARIATNPCICACNPRAIFAQFKRLSRHVWLSSVLLLITGTLNIIYGFGALDDSSTLATDLSDAGYQTAFLGKYLNGYGTSPAPDGTLHATTSAVTTIQRITVPPASLASEVHLAA